MHVASMTKAQTLTWLRNISGDLASETLKKLDDTLPWYGTMPPSRRSAVGLVAQAGITSFISWYDDPSSQPWIAADVFDAAPRELLRSVSLQQTLQLIRVVVEVVEERVKGRDESVREAILLYSREIAFAAADVYARAAEARGLWDARLEALVVDSILSGEYDNELPSRIAALGWNGHGEVCVLVGTTPRIVDVDQVRRVARHVDADVLIGVQGNRLVVVIGRATPRGEDGTDTPPTHTFAQIAEALEPSFGEGHLVLGPDRPPHPHRPHLHAAQEPQRRAARDPLGVPRQRSQSGGDGARAVRAPQHGPLPPQAHQRGHRLGCDGVAGGAHPAVRPHRRLDRGARRAPALSRRDPRRVPL